VDRLNLELYSENECIKKELKEKINQLLKYKIKYWE
jgi:hypothetical protein